MPPKSKRGPKKITSTVFSEQEVGIFNQVFQRLSADGDSLQLTKYVNYITDLTQNNKGSIMARIVNDLQAEGDKYVDFEGFLEILEDKVGNIKTTQGLEKIFSFITNQSNSESANLIDLRRIRDELGLTVGDKDLQKLVNFITASYNTTDKFSFAEFEDYVFKTHPRN